MVGVAAASTVRAVLERSLYRSYAVDELRASPGSVIELSCRCPREVSAARYRVRGASRHVGHLDQVLSADELWLQVSEPVAGGWPVIEIDTNAAVDLPGIAHLIRRSM